MRTHRLPALTIALISALGSTLLAATPAAAGPPGRPAPTPVPSAKASSPSTDLQDYPKLPVAVTDPGSTIDLSLDPGVVSIVWHTDGTVDLTTYTPAPGVSDEQLFWMLQRQGVTGLLDPATTTNNSLTSALAVGSRTTAVTLAAACTIGTAHTNGCPGIHWANNGFAHPQVYFVDHTSSAWPVDLATYTWNQAQNIDSLYVWGSCPGVAGTHCVNLYDADYGATGWTALSSTPFDANLNILDGRAVTRFNDHYPGRAVDRRSTACHEQGHDLGLAHNDATDSCLYSTRISSAPQNPDGYDYALLKNVYSFVH